MKKALIKCLFATVILISAASITNAQARIYVKVRPTEVVTTRTVAPHSNYVWIGDEWQVKRGAYVHVPGYWAPPRRNFIWVPGHWTSERRGDYWIPGHWRRA